MSQRDDEKVGQFFSFLFGFCHLPNNFQGSWVCICAACCHDNYIRWFFFFYLEKSEEREVGFSGATVSLP